MLTQEQMELFGDRLAPIYRRLEKAVIQDIARRVKKTGRWTETAELMAEALIDKGYAPKKIRRDVLMVLNADSEYRKVITQNTLEYKKVLAEEIEIARESLKELSPELYSEVGETAFREDMGLWERAGGVIPSKSNAEVLVAAMQERALDDLLNLTKTTGFRKPNGMIVQARMAYTSVMNDAIVEVTSGAFAYRQSVERAVRTLAKSGLRHVDYESGRTWNTDTAAMNAIRTTSAQLSGAITDRNIRETGVGKVEVSAHWGARPSHAKWQGRVYTLDEFERICGYGNPRDAANIYSYGCRHVHFPFWDGISEPTKWDKEPPPVTVNGVEYSYYHATQKQRAMERNIRALKRERYTVKALGSDTDELSGKIHGAIRDYHLFSKAVNISPKPNRLRVV